eukprot:m.311868 g.311868  ORF g.311868 m.311868 type:complete len:323 (-) comp55375_c0_seq2:71-1039(-)
MERLAAYALLAFVLFSSALGVRNVIFDTDIGTDFDDSVALAYALQNPNINVKMVLTATGNTLARAQVVAKYLTLYGRTDIPIGIGVATELPDGPLFAWAADFDIMSYEGQVYPDGVGGMIAILEEIAAVGDSVDIIAIAPCNNFPSLLSRAPNVTQIASVKAMSGSIYRGYGNSSTPSAEYNVATCPSCTASMYSAGWNVTTTPLDTCGTVALSGGAYLNYLQGTSVVSHVLAQSQLFWSVNGGNNQILTQSSIWYDSVAAYMTDSFEFLELTPMRVSVTSDGYTVPSPTGALLTVALNWGNYNQDEALYESALSSVLANSN